MPEILLSTLNAKYIHAAFGLRYLRANLGELQARSGILEFDINQKPIDIAEVILAAQPIILGLGVYIWNVQASTELIEILKRTNPDLCVIIGGPEVSYECDQQEIVRLADYVITGEADLEFAEICRTLIRGEKPSFKIIAAPLPDVDKLQSPYELYDERDIAHRIIYVEVSRGCPFTCEFCLSSLDIPVRQFALAPFTAALQRLYDRGVRHFKFVDRTFNLNLNISRAILEFFLERWTPGLFVHFEMVPDRLPEALREIISRFPPGALQFEVGIQTLNPQIEKNISRRQSHERMEDNLRWLREKSGVHIHADLIAGLPGENLKSIAAGFDRLLSFHPQEIQLGILKRLRGTPIVRHDAEYRMIYCPHPPYEVLKTKDLDFPTLGALRRFAKFWDLYGNSGNFSGTFELLWTAGGASDSPFESIWEFSNWLHLQGVKTSGIALTRQYELLWKYLTGVRSMRISAVAPLLIADYQRSGRSDIPPWLRSFLGTNNAPAASEIKAATLPSRQSRHLKRSERPATSSTEVIPARGLD